MDRNFVIPKQKGAFDLISKAIEKSNEQFIDLSDFSKEEIIKVLDAAEPRKDTVQVNIHYNEYYEFTYEELVSYAERGYYIEGYNYYPWIVTSYANSDVKELDLSRCCPDYLRTLSGMFSGCIILKKLKLFNNIRTYCENPISADNMFGNCSNLEEIDLSHFSTYHIHDMSNMFYGCENLKELDLSKFIICNVTKMSNMFDFCSNLTELKLPELGCNEQCTELNLSYSPNLSIDSINYLIDNAFNRKEEGYKETFYITLNEAISEKLSAELIEKAKGKGFDISFHN